ncbi:type II secretion system F family protein [Thermoactinomyces daqus]|uniref:Type II secretion system F family protein n=1 Tax=Thermoactinomyces daqus TaxID=1329516 RepID=A0A7W1XC45_9BACL|nr:type II secretion system F family protein [Thermoactinomyces daqus]MBA4543936.1 type II secretion system F family protein [Thermoactinomyces daqus]
MVRMKRRWKTEKLMVFSQQMGHLLESGISLLTCLDLLVTQQLITSSLYEKLKKELENGGNLSSALQKCAFPNLFISFIRAAEEHGDYVFGFKQCASYYAARAKWSREFGQACFYPLLVFCIAIGAIFFLVSIVLPRFSELYQTLGIPLPAITQWMFLLSHSFHSVLLFAGGSICLLSVGGGLIRMSSDRLQAFFTRMLLWLPGIGQYYRYRFTHYVATQLGSLLAAGVPLLTALDVMATLTPWVLLTRRIHKVKKCLMQGDSFAGAVKKKAEPLFLPLFVQMVTLAEESGKLDEILLHLSEGTEKMMKYKIERLTRSLEPAFIFAIGLFVALTVIGMFLPVLQLVRAL